MDAASVAVHCYWNGRVKMESKDVDYEGDNVNMMPINLNYGTTYAELLDKICTITGIDRFDFEFNIICRYPISSREYKPIPIKNDEAVELMLEVPIRSGVSCVEIYLESNAVSFPVEANAPANVQISPSIRLLEQESNAVYGGNDGLADKLLSKDGYGNTSVRRPLTCVIVRKFYYGEASSKNSNDPPTYDDKEMGGRKWEDLNMDCLVNVFHKVGIESLLLDVPRVCKSWHRASLDPKCWESLMFPEDIKCKIWDNGRFSKRLMMEYQENFSSTAFIKFVIDRSRGCAAALGLPGCCTEEALEYAANECPELKTLKLNTDPPNKQRKIIPRLMPKWKNLEVLVLDRRHKMKEILDQIALHCSNFMRLSAPGINVGNWEASAIVTSLPNLRYLVLNGATIERKSVVMILQDCKQLVHLDARGCTRFDEDDAEILELASHIPSFMCEGSRRNGRFTLRNRAILSLGHRNLLDKSICMNLSHIDRDAPCPSDPYDDYDLRDIDRDCD